NESGWIGRDGSNTYSGLAWGWPYGPLNQVTGRSTGFFGLVGGSATLISSAIGADFNSGHMIVFCSNHDGVDPRVVASHCYAMLGYDCTTQTFSLGNPWGPDNPILTQSVGQLFHNFGYFAETDPSTTITGIYDIIDHQHIVMPSFQIWVNIDIITYPYIG